MSKVLRTRQKKAQNLSGCGHIHPRLQIIFKGNDLANSQRYIQKTRQFEPEQTLLKPQKAETEPHRLPMLELTNTEIKTTVLNMFKEIDNTFLKYMQGVGNY